MSKNINFRKIVALTLLFFITIFYGSIYNFNLNNINNYNYINASGQSITINKTANNAKSIIKNEILDNNINFQNYDNNAIVGYNKTNKQVYLGGIPIGIKVNAGGLLVTGYNKIYFNNTACYQNKNIQIGDVITKINNKQVFSIKDLQNVISDSKSNIVDVSFTRKNIENNVKLNICKDEYNNKVIGFKVKDNIVGLGTLTYVDTNKRFASLGHHIIDSDTGACAILNKGNIFNSIIVNATKGDKGKAGHLNGMIVDNNVLGNVDKNCNYGLYGYSNDNIIKGLTKIDVASRDEIKLGKAKVFTTIEGVMPKLYDIEIVRLHKQNSIAERGIIVKITDKKLISSAGGIVQGMSGSPIIQNGKLVGALTHVFLNDAKKGYGIYIDSMLPN